MEDNPSNQSMPNWLNTSELPFFVVLKNTPQNGVTSSSTSSANSLVTSENRLYPEVHYIFEDDDFSPTIDVLEQHKNDISVIIDFNEEGDEVIAYKSLSPSWQILKVATQSSVTPTWASDPNGRPSTTLLIEGTNSEANGIVNSGSSTDSKFDSDSIGDMKLLVESFKARNEQLKQILFENDAAVSV